MSEGFWSSAQTSLVACEIQHAVLRCAVVAWLQVGLTNMNVQAVSSIVDAGVPVANNQVRRIPPPVYCDVTGSMCSITVLLAGCTEGHQLKSLGSKSTGCAPHIVSEPGVEGDIANMLTQNNPCGPTRVACTGSVQPVGQAAPEWHGGLLRVKGHQGGCPGHDSLAAADGETCTQTTTSRVEEVLLLLWTGLLLVLHVC